MEKLSVSTKNLDLPEPARELIRERAGKLERFYPRILACSVLVEGPGPHHRSGGPFKIRIDMRVPGGEPLVVSRQNADDLSVAVRESFDAAVRRLQDFARLQRGQVKNHEATARGRVERLFTADGYGFLKTPDGRQIYFHRNSVLDDHFGQLQVGSEVTFHEEQGDKGPQASTIIAR